MPKVNMVLSLLLIAGCASPTPSPNSLPFPQLGDSADVPATALARDLAPVNATTAENGEATDAESGAAGSDASSPRQGASVWAEQPCAACHGADGQGAVGPALAATGLDRAAFLAVLREGRSPMPAFTSAQLDDEDVTALHAWLATLPAPAPTEAVAQSLASDAVLPPGVELERVVDGLPYPVALAWGPPPFVSAGARNAGDVAQVLYVATNGRAFPLPDERAGAIYWLEPGSDQPKIFAQDIDRPLGLQFVDLGLGEGPELFVSSRGRVSVWADGDGDGQGEETRIVVDALPAFGLHQNNGLALGPDGWLYLGMGSASNADSVDDPRDGSILRFRPDGSRQGVYATGLRNAFGLAFGPPGALFATDNGVDPPLRQDAPEELNHIVEGGDYGHPRIFGIETPPADSSALGPIATFPSHASANGLLFPSGAMFPELEGHLLVAEFGSYLEGYEDRGRRLMLVALDPDGASYRAYTQPWVDGFPGRPLALSEGPDGAIYVADFESDSVWRLRR